ncbi:MAG: futalosine hydrolase [Actinomycetes bacterium]
MRVLVVTAVDAERTAVLRGLVGSSAPVTVLATGVGQSRAAAATADACARFDPDLVVCAGMAGVLPGRAQLGDVLLASRVVAAQLGVERSDVEAPDGLRVRGEPWAPFRLACDQRLVALVGERLTGTARVVTGEILTVDTVTASAARAQELLRDFDEGIGEAMEGFGARIGAGNRPFVEVRTTSNVVGPRDRGAWRTTQALDRLTEVARAVLCEEIRW